MLLSPVVSVTISMPNPEKKIATFSSDLEQNNDYSIRTSRWNPDDLASILTEMGYSEDKLKAVDTGFPYDAVKPIGAN